MGTHRQGVTPPRHYQSGLWLHACVCVCMCWCFVCVRVGGCGLLLPVWTRWPRQRRRVQGVRWRCDDAYYYLLYMPVYCLVPVMAAFVVAVSAVFAGIYAAVPGSMVRGTETVSAYSDFLLISLSVMADLDTGAEVDGVPMRLAYLVEGLLQLIALAVLVGVVVDRITRPQPRVVFSKRALLGWFNRRPTLQFRLAWERPQPLVGAELRVYVLRAYTTAEGFSGLRMEELPLVTSTMPVFGLVWNARHIVDERSPLATLLPQVGLAPPLPPGAPVPDITPASFEILAFMQGEDPLQRETIRMLHSYTWPDVEMNARFEDMISFPSPASTHMDLRLLNVIIPLEGADAALCTAPWGSAGGGTAGVTPACGPPPLASPAALEICNASGDHYITLPAALPSPPPPLLPPPPPPASAGKAAAATGSINSPPPPALLPGALPSAPAGAGGGGGGGGGSSAGGATAPPFTSPASAMHGLF